MASWEIPEQKNGGFKWENHLSLLCYWRESFSHWNLGSWDWSDIVWIHLTGPGGLKRLGTLGTKLLKSLWFPRMPLSQLGWFGYLMVSVAFFKCFQENIHNIQEIYNHPNILIFSPVHHILVPKFLPISTWKPQFWPTRWYPQRRTKLALFTRWRLIEHLWWNYHL